MSYWGTRTKESTDDLAKEWTHPNLQETEHWLDIASSTWGPHSFLFRPETDSVIKQILESSQGVFHFSSFMNFPLINSPVTPHGENLKNKSTSTFLSTRSEKLQLNATWSKAGMEPPASADRKIDHEGGPRAVWEGGIRCSSYNPNQIDKFVFHFTSALQLIKCEQQFPWGREQEVENWIPREALSIQYSNN
jgi:hypothetical protein